MNPTTVITAAVAGDDAARGLEAEDGESVARFLIDPSVYTEDAIFKAAYWFTGTHYVFIDRAADGRISVELRPMPGTALGDAAGEFRNALIDARIRQIVLREVGAVRDEIVRMAFREGGR